MHNAAFEALGLEWRYLALGVPPERFEETVKALPASGYRGVNVTVPHKLAALRLADRSSAAAAAIGAANTLTFAGGGEIAAENTDAPGLIAAIGAPSAGLRAVVLGAGGAARAAAWALREAGAAVSVWNRTRERAVRLASELGVRQVDRPGAAHLLVNATTIGLDADVEERAALDSLGLAGADPPATVVDLVYARATTPVCAWAERGGARVIDGLEVLVRQGALSFELWTGQSAPLEIMRAAARGAAPDRVR